MALLITLVSLHLLLAARKVEQGVRVNIEAIQKNPLFAGLCEADLDALQAVARVREDQAARAAADAPGRWHPRLEPL